MVPEGCFFEQSALRIHASINRITAIPSTSITAVIAKDVEIIHHLRVHIADGIFACVRKLSGVCACVYVHFFFWFASTCVPSQFLYTRLSPDKMSGVIKCQPLAIPK